MAELTTPTPQPASTPGPATPLHLTLPVAYRCRHHHPTPRPAPPHRRLEGDWGEERGAVALQGGWGCHSPQTGREPQHFNKGNVSLGTFGVPVGPPTTGGLTPLQGIGPRCSRTAPTPGTPTEPAGCGWGGWPLRQCRRACRVTGASHGDLRCAQRSAALDGLLPLALRGPIPTADRAPQRAGSPPQAPGSTSRRGHHPAGGLLSGCSEVGLAWPPLPLPMGLSPKVSLSQPRGHRQGRRAEETPAQWEGLGLPLGQHTC